MDKLKHIRQDYNKFALSESDLTDDPMDLFELWMNIALDSDEEEPTAMQFASVNKAGQPSLRVLLLKGFDRQGFYFYTNYSSQKGIDMAVNPKVAMTIFWKSLHKQIRVEGVVNKIPREESVAYFQSRPRESQIGAWASSQSEKLSGPEELSQSFDRIKKEFKDHDPLPCPEDWGGYVIVPSAIEFWQGRPNRLHDRFRYVRNKNVWSVNRLWP
jgi:pyridoxamine 5'-phosphate oxidase